MLESLNKLIPDGLVFADVMKEACGKRSVVTFGFLVGLLVIFRRRLMLDTEDVAYGLPEFGDDLETVVRQD